VRSHCPGGHRSTVSLPPCRSAGRGWTRSGWPPPGVPVASERCGANHVEDAVEFELEGVRFISGFADRTAHDRSVLMKSASHGTLRACLSRVRATAMVELGIAYGGASAWFALRPADEAGRIEYDATTTPSRTGSSSPGASARRPPLLRVTRPMAIAGGDRLRRVPRRAHRPGCRRRLASLRRHACALRGALPVDASRWPSTSSRIGRGFTSRQWCRPYACSRDARETERLAAIAERIESGVGAETRRGWRSSSCWCRRPRHD
jgi:hypothetical protein